MPATSIFRSALSAGISGIGNSRISVLLGPVLTAASTLSIMGRGSHARAVPEAPRARRRRCPRETLGAKPLCARRRLHGARHRARERGARLSADQHRGGVLDRGTKALSLSRLQAARGSRRSGYPARLVPRGAGG